MNKMFQQIIISFMEYEHGFTLNTMHIALKMGQEMRIILNYK